MVGSDVDEPLGYDKHAATASGAPCSDTGLGRAPVNEDGHSAAVLHPGQYPDASGPRRLRAEAMNRGSPRSARR